MRRPRAAPACSSPPGSSPAPPSPAPSLRCSSSPSRPASSCARSISPMHSAGSRPATSLLFSSSSASPRSCIWSRTRPCSRARPMVNVRLAESEPDRKLCLSLRWTVFVEEQGVPPSMEVDEHDHKGAVHAIATGNGVPAATGRFVLDGKGEAKIGRMAVVDDVRGRGIGRGLLAFLEEQARARGAKKVPPGAQVRPGVFYEKAVWGVVRQKPFDDADIPHVAMEKHAA